MTESQRPGQAAHRQRPKAEPAQGESEHLARSATDALSDHIAILDETGVIIAVNRAWRSFAEANHPPPSNVCEGANYLAVCDAARGADAGQAAACAAAVRAVIRGEQQAFSLDYPCHSPDQQRWFNVRVTRFSSEGAVRVVVAHENITARKQAEDALRESEERYRVVVEDLTEVISRFKADGTLTFVNDVYCRFFGKTSRELLGSKWHPQAVAEDLPAIEAKLRSLSPTNPVVVVENRVYSGSGKVRWMQFVNRGFFDAEGRLVEIQSVGRDITERKRAEEALRESEMKYRRLHESMMDAFVSVDMTGRIQEFNPAYQAMLGYSREELGRLSYMDLTPEKWHAVESKIVAEEILRHGHSGVYEKEYRRKDGTVVPVELRVFLIQDAAGQPVSMWAIVRDITERKRLQKEAALREQRLNALFSGATAGLALMDKDLRFIQINDTLAEMNGLPAREHLGRTVREVLPMFAPVVEPIIRKVLATGEPVSNIEVTGETARQPGVQRHWIESFFPVAEPDGLLEGVGAIVVEITERKRAEAELLREKEFIESLTRCLAGAFYLFDSTGKLLRWNRNLETVSGCSFEEIGQMRALDFIAEEDRPLAAQHIEEALEKGEAEAELQLLSKSRKKTPYQFTGVRIMIDNKPCIVGVGLDITERKRAEAALREAERFSLATIDALSAHICVLDETGRIITVNRAWRAFADANPPAPENVAEGADYLAACDSATGRDAAEAAAFAAGIRAVMSGERDEFSLEYPCHSPDEQRWFIGRATRFAGEGPVRIVVSHENITERRQAEAALRKSEELFRSLSASSPMGIFVSDVAGKNIYANPRCRELLGLALPEIAGEGWVSAIHPDDRDRVLGGWNESVRDREGWSSEHRVVTPTGVHRWISVRTAPMRSESGNLTGYVGTMEDITERKQAQAELEASQKALRALAVHLQTVREEERARIARVVHDELGHAFTDLKLDLAWLDRRLKKKSASDQSDVRRRISTMIERVEADLEIARRISAELRPAVLDTLGFMAAMEWEIRQFEKRSGIDCELDLPPDPPALDAGRSTTLFRIFQEITSNVVHHAGASQVQARIAVEAGQVVMEVSDNGRGITEQEIASPHAMGLLSMRQRALEFGGTVAIQGVPGEGTNVRVTIPLEHP